MASTRVQAAPIQITGLLDMRMHRITGLETDLTAYPVEDNQGASKKYVDAQRDAVISSLQGDVDNGSF